MSAESIARWNAIPMERPAVEVDPNDSLKRPRDAMDEDGDSDDNVSLISRTPSPPPQDRMEVDKYDEYTRGVEREVITVDTKIGSSNKGFAMLAKLGWVEGQPLGLSAEGRVDPIPFIMKNDSTGLGKTTQDVRMIESTVSQRRELDSERMTKETEDQRKAREETVAKRHAVQSELSTVLRPFYCELCDKQFQNVAQYDEHTNSYAHHHKARLRDMQAAQRATFASDADKRKEKEKKREEKELRKIAKAAGIRMPKVTAALAPAAPGSSESHGEPAVKKGGWASVTSSSSAPPQPPFTPGRATVSQPPPPPPSLPPPPPQPHAHAAAPAFRTGGWSSLDASSSSLTQTAPPPFPPSQTSPSLPAVTRGGWAAVPPSAYISTHSQPQPPAPSTSTYTRGGWSSSPPTTQPAPPPAAMQTIPPASTPTPNVNEAPTPAAVDKPKPAAKRQEAARSGWQQFKAGGARRR